MTSVEIDEETFEEIIKVIPGPSCRMRPAGPCLCSAGPACRHGSRARDGNTARGAAVGRACSARGAAGCWAGWAQRRFSGGSASHAPRLPRRAGHPPLLRTIPAVAQATLERRALRTTGMCSLPLPLQTNKRMVPYLFVRGDGVILVSPPLRS